jgi:hypothetical protein
MFEGSRLPLVKWYISIYLFTSMKKGISEVRGGIKVLTDMNYPKEILANTQKIKA